MCKQPECVSPPPIEEQVDAAYEFLQQIGHRDIDKEDIKNNLTDYVGLYCEDITENPKPHWNYRMVSRVDPWTDKTAVAIAKVEYVNGEVSGMDSSGPVTLISASSDDLNKVMHRLNLATQRPVLTFEEVEAGEKKYPKPPICNHESCWSKAGMIEQWRAKNKKEESAWS